MTQTYAVRYTRTVVDSDPETFLDHARFTDAGEADAFCVAIARQHHITSAYVVEVASGCERVELDHSGHYVTCDSPATQSVLDCGFVTDVCDLHARR